MNKWLLLLHQIPPKPPYFRAKVLRRMNQLGALAVKNSAYLLPGGEETLEDLVWVRREIVEQGGEAWVFRVDAVAGLADEAIREGFRALRAPDYAGLLESARALQQAIEQANGAGEDPHTGHEAEWRKLGRRQDEVRRIDFFDAPGSEEMEAIMSTIDRTLHTTAKGPAAKPGLGELKGRPWVTRRGIKVDRIGSAWFVRRFLDPDARFLFVDPAGYAHSPGHIRFDMFEGEFTHDGDLCTFEVLLRWSGIEDAALAAVAEVVHDIDLKDGKHGRPEAAGLGPIISGIALRHADDTKRLEEGVAVFESLYASFRGSAGGSP